MNSILKFKSADNRYDIDVLSVGGIDGLWHKFEGRIDPSTGRTADTYCKYTSSSVGTLQMWVPRPSWGRLAPKSEEDLVTISAGKETEGKEWSNRHPVFYETGGKYHFHIKIRDVRGNAHVVHPLKDVSDSFSYTPTGNSTGLLTGIIDFLNQPGSFALKFEYISTEGKRHQEYLTFEVVSPKLDTKHDLKEITRLIDEEYENYVYQYLSLTFQSQKIERASKSEDDVWMCIFQSIVDKYINAVRYIEHHTNLRSVQRVYHHKPEKIKRWNQKELEKMANRGSDADKYYYRNQVSEQTINTKENRFVKHTLQVISDRLEEVFKRIEKKYGDKLSKEYAKQIKDYRDTFHTIRNNKFFRLIGKFDGRMQESQVLQQRAGYRNVYVCWQMLRSVINLEEGSTQIGMRMIWKLYEVWCFLVMKRLICKILDIKDQNDKTRIEAYGSTLIECLEDETKSCNYRFYFDEDENKNGERKTAFAELIYQCRYKYDESAREEHTLTIEQIPDIVMNIHRKGNTTLTYLFDAKYRVLDDKGSEMANSTDEPVRETLNTMHHYRDAILYGTIPDRMNGIEKDVSKEVIGGYILFPGRVSSDEKLENKYYIKSIDKVNIGAFPVMPAKYEPAKGNENQYLACGKLEEFLRKLLFERQVINHIGKSIPQRGLQYTDDPGLSFAKKWTRTKTLIFAQTIQSKWNSINELKYIAIALDFTQNAMEIVRDFSKVKYIVATNLEEGETNQIRLFKIKGTPQLRSDMYMSDYWIYWFGKQGGANVYLVFELDNPTVTISYPLIDAVKINKVHEASIKNNRKTAPCITKMSDIINPIEEKVDGAGFSQSNDSTKHVHNHFYGNTTYVENQTIKKE